MKVVVNANKTHTQTLYACNSKSEHSVETKPPTAVASARAPTHDKQGSHGTRRHEGGYSGPRVERPFLRKSCFLHRRGAYFQNITFPGPVEKGHRDVVNHMPWRTATRHCVHSVMLSCMTPTQLQAVRQHSVNWSGTPVVAGQGPAAAHCAELRSFRRGCMAMRSRKGNV